jgi:beta-lactam-binding protein with PASTA domain
VGSDKEQTDLVGAADNQDDAVASTEDDQDRRRLATFVASAVLLLVVIWVLTRLLGCVPNTVGMSEAQSEEIINEAGFGVATDTVLADGQIPGIVVDQSPGGGLYFKFWAVDIWISGGTGAGSEQASVVWQEDNGLLAEAPGPGPEGEEVLPSDAEEVDPLYYPMLPAERLMPNVQSMSESRALSTLWSSGVSAIVEYGPTTSDVPEGQVYFQDPRPGIELTGRPTATIWISTGPFNILGKDSYHPNPPYRKPYLRFGE